MRLSLLVLLALAACEPATTPDPGGDSATMADNDGDGFVGDADCDETDGTVHDGAAELCDGIDNDCDGVIDDGATNSTTFYQDNDEDGYGDPASPMTACAAPAGYVASADDCDDADPAYHPDAPETDCADPHDYNCDGSVAYEDADSDGVAACEDCNDVDANVHPGATETCNDLDDDCNGAIDDNAVDASTYYVDDDGDGYGTDETVVACALPDGAALYSGDCDDGSVLYHPSADEFDCSDPNDYNCDGSVGYADADGDGYAACEECDDGDRTHHPGATETCDGVDDDCDAEVDEADAVDAATWYADGDGDGFGDAATTQVACTKPAGYGTDDTDCDDTDATEHPGAVEVCDGDDDNCDGVADEASAVDATTWYLDADTDGYGDPATGQVACDQPAGYLANGDDCDDTDLTEHPGAAEVCDGDDDNCDGVVDESTATDAATWYADADGDGYGSTTTSLAACDQPAGYLADHSDCDDTRAAVNPLGVETCNGLDDNCDGDIDEVLSADASTWFRDADGDGYGDATAAISACGAPVGYVADSTDCDDANALAHPGASEACDGFDDDCDGQVDEDAAVDVATWFRDADGDGYGDATLSDVDCDQPAGFVADATDCNDASAAVNPGEVEVCDAANVDEDCSGAADDADAGATGKTSWYTDTDGDGYGVTASLVSACDAPAHGVATGGDCDDTTTGVSPAAAESTGDGVDENCDGRESCWVDADSDGYRDPGTATVASADADCADAGEGANSEPATDCDDTRSAVNPAASERCNGTDDDCDGQVDEDAAVDVATWFRDADGDGYGDATLSDVDCDQPAGFVADATDCNDASAAVNPGEVEVCDAANVDEDCSGAADDADAGATGESPWFRDADGDGYGDEALSLARCDTPAGYVADATDCDDAAAGTHPGATEVCDAGGVDEDCDGDVNDADSSVTGQSSWYTDADGDTYGNAALGETACFAPVGSVADATDCDDAAAGTHPGATEVVGDGVDESCDGRERCYEDDDGDGYLDSTGDTVLSADADCSDSHEAYATAPTTDCNDAVGSVYPGAPETCNGVDDDCDGAVDDGASLTWYLDADGDGYGDDGITAASCTAPAGYVALGHDCDDGDLDVNPGEAEVCDGAVDEDCDGLVDDADPGVTGQSSWYADADADGYGDPAVGESACVASPSYVADATDCNDALASVHPGATEVVGDGVDQTCDGRETCYEDDDGDGYLDTAGDTVASADADCSDSHEALATAPTTDCNDAAATVHPGAVESCNSVDDDCDGVVDDGATSTWYADADGDGYGDAASTASSCTAPSGYVADATDCDDTLPAVYPGAPTVCEDLEVNDCNGTDSGCELTGTALVSSAAHAWWYGINAVSGNDNVGISVAGLGDLTGDGKDDIVFGANQYDPSSTQSNAGRAWVYAGGATTGGRELLTTETPYARITGTSGTSNPDNLGYQVAPGGNFTGASSVDLIVGSYNTKVGTFGGAGDVMVFSRPSGSLTRTTATLLVQGVASSDNLGYDVSGGVDVSGDGRADLIAGAYLYDPSGVTNAGTGVLVLGGTTGTISLTSASAILFTGVATSDQAGQVVAALPDMTGDGIGEIGIAAYKADVGTSTDNGKVYVIYGRSGLADVSLSTAADVTLSGTTVNSAQFGRSLDSAGDVDGDGDNDLIVGADGDTAGGFSSAGAAYIYLTSAGALRTTASVTLGGTYTGDVFGRSVAGGGDFNGDGNDDVAIGGTSYDTTSYSGAGAVALWYGPVAAGSYSAVSADYLITGTSASEAVGSAVDFVGDTDGDGFDDLGLGATNWDSSTTANVGAVFLVLGTGN